VFQQQPQWLLDRPVNPRIKSGEGDDTHLEAERILKPNEADEFLVPAKQIPCSVQNRESSVAPWNCSAKGRQNRAESGKMIGDFEDSLLFSLFSGNCGL
jgi:hypothetical protein